MTIQYKNQGIDLNSTGTLSVLTCPTDATILIKQIQINNGSGSGVSLNVQVTDTSASSTFRIFNEAVTGSASKDIINYTLVLEAGDILKMTAGTADEIQGIVSYALLDRSQQNG
jgi:hypothetical protein|tara:strand:+ start:137 stop:478 length:342 start_codon:yes stop_codon:yes gene_type:complete